MPLLFSKKNGKAINEQPKEKNESMSVKLQRARELYQKWYRTQSQAFKAMVFAVSIILLLVGAFLGGYFGMIWYVLDGRYTLYTASTQPFPRYFLIGILSGHGIVCSLVIWLLSFTIFFGLVFAKSPDLDKVDDIDDNGTVYSKDGTYGTAKWMPKSDAKAKFQVGDISTQLDTEKHFLDGWILGQYTTGGKETIVRPVYDKDGKPVSGNQNYLVVSSPGRGKTFCMAYTNAIQAIVRGESICMVDPKGELCETLYTLFKEHGYITKIYNIVKPSRSNAWNFCSEIFDVNTGNMDFSRLTAFVDIVMNNTTEGDNEDEFWGSGERNLFQAGVAYLGYKYEITFARNLEQAADYWESQHLPLLSDSERAVSFDIIHGKQYSLREKEEALRAIMTASTIVSEQEIDDYIKDIKEASDPITIDRVFGLFAKNDIAAITKEFETSKIPPSHPASIAWGIFKHGDTKTQPNFVQGLTQRLKLFANADINTMSAYDDISFRAMGEKKTAIFCIISDKDSSRKLLSSLFFSFLFRDVADAADEAGKNNNRIPVNVMFDEFANIGRLPDFERFIATVRSRKIYICIIIQSVAQLAKVYDDNDRETLVECCDTVVCLGCNGEATAEFISQLGGTTTIIAQSIKDNKNVVGLRTLGAGYGESQGEGKRLLINPDEVRRMKKGEILIYHAGEQLLRAHSFGYIEHPYYKKGFPPPMPISKFPTTEQTYGKYTSIFDDVSEIDLTNQKIYNQINAKLMAKEQQEKPGPVKQSAGLDSTIPPAPKTHRSTEDEESYEVVDAEFLDIDDETTEASQHKRPVKKQESANIKNGSTGKQTSRTSGKRDRQVNHSNFHKPRNPYTTKSKEIINKNKHSHIKKSETNLSDEF